MTAKADEKFISEVIIKRLKTQGNQNRVGFYLSPETKLTTFKGSPELDLYYSNCRLTNGIPADVNIEITRKSLSIDDVKKKFNNNPKSALIICQNKSQSNLNKFQGYVYSAFTVTDNFELRNFYYNPYVNNVINEVGLGVEKFGIRNLTCLNDIINSNLNSRSKRNALFMLGDLLTGYLFSNYRLKHCFFEPSISLIRMILLDDDKKYYSNVFIKNPEISKSLLDEILTSKLDNKQIVGDNNYLLIDKSVNTDDLIIEDYINGFVRVSSSKNYVSKGKSIIEISSY